MKDRIQVQNEALKAIQDNNYQGTIVLDMGSGKCKIAIDAIKSKDSLNVLITSPRTNLKENWKKELEKWGCHLTGENNWWITDRDEERRVFIDLVNIQTCYKWTLKQIQIYDYIIEDEIHTMVTSEYGALLVKAKELSIPVLGLTGTADEKKDDKALWYQQYCPIIYRYTDAIEDGIVNSRRYMILEHELSNNFGVAVSGKRGQFVIGEKVRYDYIENQIRLVEVEIINHSQITFGDNTINYWEVTNDWIGSKNKELNRIGKSYLTAVGKRRTLLNTLNSTKVFTSKIGEYILGASETDKILFFSELIAQVEGICPYSIHSKRKKEENQELLSKFDSGEIRMLSSANSLTLGLNLVGATHCIIESYNSSETLINQKMGRMNRLAVDKVATIIIFVAKNTQQEKWFNYAFKEGREDFEIYQDVRELIKNL